MPKLTNLIITSWNMKDYLIFFLLIPSLLISIFLFPQPIKLKFILYPTNPSLVSIFLSNFTHSELNHLIGNLFLYSIITFLIFNIETNKRIFYRSIFFIFTVLPILSSLLIVYSLPNLPPVQGFSPIVSSLIGYFLYSVYSYIKNIYKMELTSSFIWLILTVNFTILTAYHRTLHSFIFTTTIFLLFLYTNRTNIKKILRKIRLKYREISQIKFLGRFYRITLFLLSLTVMFSLPLLIPLNVKIETVIINTPAHYFGYCFGLIIALIIEKVEGHKRKSSIFS